MLVSVRTAKLFCGDSDSFFEYSAEIIHTFKPETVGNFGDGQLTVCQQAFGFFHSYRILVFGRGTALAFFEYPSEMRRT